MSMNLENRTNEQLVVLIQSGESEADNMLQLWQQNRGFIATIARKYTSLAEMEDLEQEGYLGLCEAVRHYEPDKGVKFINYAAFWIKQAMWRYIDNCGAVVRLPTNIHEWIKKYNRVLHEYQKAQHEWPSDCALCWLLGVEREKLRAIQKAANMRQIDSLSRPLEMESEDLTLGDTVSSGEDLEEDACRRLDREDLRRTVWVAVDQLPGDQPAVIRMIYQEGMTRIQAGEILGDGNGKVGIEEHRALRTLRLSRRSGKYQAYYEEYLAAAPVHHVGVRRFKETWTSEVEREALGGMNN